MSDNKLGTPAFNLHVDPDDFKTMIVLFILAVLVVAVENC